MSWRQPPIHTPRRCAPFGSAVGMDTERLSGRIAWGTTSGVCCMYPCTRHVLVLLSFLLRFLLLWLLFCRYFGFVCVARAVQEHNMVIVCVCVCALALNPRRAEQGCVLRWPVCVCVRVRCAQTVVGPTCARPRAGAMHTHTHTRKCGLPLLLLLLMCVCVL